LRVAWAKISLASMSVLPYLYELFFVGKYNKKYERPCSCSGCAIMYTEFVGMGGSTKLVNLYNIHRATMNRTFG